jgi:hypothetical protein
MLSIAAILLMATPALSQVIVRPPPPPPPPPITGIQPLPMPQMPRCQQMCTPAVCQPGQACGGQTCTTICN